jgi:DNA-binding MarR family transcriptional regulator
MDGVDLYVLARRLLKVGESAIPAAGIHRLPTSVQLVLMDVSDHPDTSISEIVHRVGFPQSLVSGAVKRMELGGALVTRTDPDDRRRTLVRVAPDVRARSRKVQSRPLTDVVRDALGTDDAAEVDEVVEMLTRLARRFEQAAVGQESAPRTRDGRKS